MAKIYLIKNTKNGKCYVGQTTNSIIQRFAQHIDSAFRTAEVKRNIFYTEIKQADENILDVFRISLLEVCDDSVKNEREKFYIDKIKPEYNEMFKQSYLMSNKQDIIKEYCKGKTIDELRIKYSCRSGFISKLLKDENIQVKRSRPKKGKKVFLFNAKGEAIKSWLNAGECSFELKIDRGNIRCCCIKNSKENILYFSANGYHFKYNDEMPNDMYKIENKKNGEVHFFKTKESLVDFFKTILPDKNIIFSQLVRDRKSMYGYIITKLYEHRN